MRELPSDILAAVAPDLDPRLAVHRDAAAIPGATAATPAIVGVPMAACGCGAGCALLGVPVLLPAAASAAWARVLRAPR